MQINENILCLYTSGLSGTWLSWFIDQHNNFPKYTFTKESSHSTITDLCCDGATWCFTTDTENGAGMSPLAFEDYIEEYAIPESKNSDATKNCCKVLPDHDLSWNHSPEVLSNVLKPFSRIIVPYLPPDSPFVDMYAKRNRYMWHENFPAEFGIQDYTRMIVGAKTRIVRGHYSQFGKPVHTVNLHNLLMCDQWEYKNLTDFIDEDQIDGWEDHVNNYRQQFICRDWGGMYDRLMENNEKDSE